MPSRGSSTSAASDRRRPPYLSGPARLESSSRSVPRAQEARRLRRSRSCGAGRRGRRCRRRRSGSLPHLAEGCVAALGLRIGLDQQAYRPVSLILIHRRQSSRCRVVSGPLGRSELRARVDRPVRDHRKHHPFLVGGVVNLRPSRTWHSAVLTPSCRNSRQAATTPPSAGRRQASARARPPRGFRRPPGLASLARAD